MIGPILSALPWRLIGIGAAVVGAGLYVSHLRSQVADRDAVIETQRAQLDQAAAANAQQEAALAQLRADHTRKLAAVTAEATKAAARQTRVTVAREGIRHAPTESDGPVSDVLRGAVDRLRRPGPGAADDPNPGRAP